MIKNIFIMNGLAGKRLKLHITGTQACSLHSKSCLSSGGFVFLQKNYIVYMYKMPVPVPVQIDRT